MRASEQLSFVGLGLTAAAAGPLIVPALMVVAVGAASSTVGEKSKSSP